MYATCDACGGQQRWHPQVHLAASPVSGCVDEELVPLLEGVAHLRLTVLRSCQDELHSGRVALLFASSADAQRFLDEVVRTAPEDLRLRLLEASCPPRIEELEWSVAAVVQASFGDVSRVLAVELQVDFPRSDLPVVVACLSGEIGVSPGITDQHRPRGEVDLVAALQSRISAVLDLADEDSFALLRLDESADDLLRALVGPERWDVPSPGFYPGLRTIRPPLTTWLALRATVTALDLWDVDRDEADLDFHLEGARLAQRWCARSYRLLTDEDLDDLAELEDWKPASRAGHPRHPRPSYHGRGVGQELDKETSSPLELDERTVVKLVVRGALAALDHEDQLTLMAEVGEYPRGDPRRPVETDDGADAHRSVWAAVSDVVRGRQVEVSCGDTSVKVRVGNLRVLTEAARQVCALPGGVAYACAISYELSGRPSRVTFVPCRREWTQLRASSLRPGDLLHEDVDYPYVVGQVIFSDDGNEVAVERSGRGWLSLQAAALVRAQRGRARPVP